MTMRMMTMVPPPLARAPQLVIIIVLVLCVSYINCDTIHFTNSPSYLITKKNFSTYKLDVPGSEPITIFEESKKFSKRTNQYVPPPTFVTSKKQVTAYQSDEDADDRYSRPQFQYGGDESNKHMISRYGSVERLQDNPKNTYVSAAVPMTVISPDIPPASPYSSDSPAFPQNDGATDDDENASKTTVYSPILLDKFLKDYADKLKNADSFTKEKLYEIAKITENKQLPKPIEPSPTPVDRNDNTADDDKPQQQQKKSYAHNRPYGGGGGGSSSSGSGTNGGWVTLDPVPWSTSKISKWQSNKQSSYPPSRPYPDDDYYSRPERPDRPERPYGPTYIDEESDNFYNRPSSNNQQHNGNYGGFLKPAYEPIRPVYDRPRPIEPDYQYLQRPSNGNTNNYDRPPSWLDDDRKGVNNGGGYGGSTHNSYPNRPWQDELIIDDGPMNFPGSKYPPKRHDFYTENKRHPGAYPASHPSNGNGEWVLISTTKGYQFPPKRHGQRAMAFAPASVSAHKSVKLTVLSSNKTDKYGNRIPTTTSHNGMLEVDSSTQTMEEAVLNDQYPTKPTKAKKKPLKKLAFTSKSHTQDSGAVMAAIGAGMVPATMALIAPMVLGRRRRRRSVDYPMGAELNVTYVPYTDYESSIQKNFVN